MTLACCPSGRTPPRRSTGSSTRHYERRSIAVTSNIHPSGFDTIMPKTPAGASTDRLMHHAHLVTTTGDSHRLAEALAGKGVVPLN
ncbi:ATP-binding protein [Streptomyces sp. L7]